MYVFGIFIHIDLFMALSFILFISNVFLVNLWRARECAVRTGREQKTDASTAVWHLAGPDCPTSKREPKGQLLAVSPGAERERGLKTDKGKGLQGFTTIYSCYSNHFCKYHCKGCRARWGPRNHHLSHRGNILLMVRDLDLNLGAACVFKLRTTCSCFAALLDNVRHRSSGLRIGHRTQIAPIGQLRTTEWTLRSMTVNRKHKSAIIILISIILITIIINSIPPSLNLI